MKKFIAVILSFVMLFQAAACGSSSSTESENKTQDSETVEVDKGLLNVDVTMPASFFEGQSPDEIKADAEKAEFSDCIVHEDGSVTYKMTKNKHKEMLKSLKNSFDEVIAETVNEKNAVEKEIKYNKNMSRIDVLMDASRYEEWNTFSILSYYMIGSYYQAFAGTPGDEMDVVVNAVNYETKEIINSFSLRDMAESDEDATQ